MLVLKRHKLLCDYTSSFQCYSFSVIITAIKITILYPIFEPTEDSLPLESWFDTPLLLLFVWLSIIKNPKMVYVTILQVTGYGSNSKYADYMPRQNTFGRISYFCIVIMEI